MTISVCLAARDRRRPRDLVEVNVVAVAQRSAAASLPFICGAIADAVDLKRSFEKPSETPVHEIGNHRARHAPHAARACLVEPLAGVEGEALVGAFSMVDVDIVGHGEAASSPFGPLTLTVLALERRCYLVRHWDRPLADA